MAAYRRNRINDAAARVLGEGMREVRDPRVAGALVTVTAVDITPDLKYAKVFFSVLGGDADEVARGLESAKGFLRSKLAAEVNLRITPELTFVPDTSIAHGAHINELLHKAGLGGKKDE